MPAGVFFLKYRPFSFCVPSQPFILGRTDSRSPGSMSYLPSFFTKLESTSPMVMSKKQEIFRKLNSCGGGDNDMGNEGSPFACLFLFSEIIPQPLCVSRVQSKISSFGPDEID